MGFQVTRGRVVQLLEAPQKALAALALATPKQLQEQVGGDTEQL